MVDTTTKMRFPRIVRVTLTRFSLFNITPTVTIDFNEGVFCLAGANGLGKSTFLSALNYGLTGIVSDPERIFSSVDEYFKHSDVVSGLRFPKSEDPITGVVGVNCRHHHPAEPRENLNVVVCARKNFAPPVRGCTLKFSIYDVEDSVWLSTRLSLVMEYMALQTLQVASFSCAFRITFNLNKCLPTFVYGRNPQVFVLRRTRLGGRIPVVHNKA